MSDPIRAPRPRRFGKIDADYGMRLATIPPDEDGPVLMVNYMKYRERASYRDGTDGGRSGVSAQAMEWERSTSNSIHSVFIVPAEHSELLRQSNPQVCGDSEPLQVGDQPVFMAGRAADERGRDVILH